MTALLLEAGAPSHNPVQWHQIEWSRCHREVRRLQARIVKAMSEGRWGKVKALQWLLTHSFHGKALAVKRVTENQGKNTPGVDGETWSTPESKSTAILLMRRQGYRPSPLRRVYIPKSNGKLRPLGIPTLRDRAMQALHLLSLDPVSETVADGFSYGFRTHRSAADAIERCFGVLARQASLQWVLEGDIKACFDRISHDWLLANVRMDRTILRKWLKAGFVSDGVLSPTEEGTPQGGIISPVLANLALDGLQAMLRDRFTWVTKNKLRGCVNLVRYADDFVVTGRSKEFLEHEVLPAVVEFLRERGLELSQEKTLITHIDQGFDFLGQNIRKYGGKLLIRPSDKSVRSLMDKIRGVVRTNKQVKQSTLIRLLNPIITGWGNYHRHVVSKDTFHKVDNLIWQCLWRWAKRRHPRKRLPWIKNRYFHRIGTRDWIFAAEERHSESDDVKLFKLEHLSKMAIVRHVAVKSEANPYDQTWESYFEERLSLRMARSLTGRRVLLSLWISQGGKCAHCGEKITKQSGWHVHHIRWRSRGGSSRISNLAFLHPNCHRQVHSRDIEVRKPAP